MTALSRRSNRSYINCMSKGVVGSCQRESALKSPIPIAAFVINSEVEAMFSANFANRHHDYARSTDHLRAYITITKLIHGLKQLTRVTEVKVSSPHGLG